MGVYSEKTLMIVPLTQRNENPLVFSGEIDSPCVIASEGSNLTFATEIAELVPGLSRDCFGTAPLAVTPDLYMEIWGAPRR